MSLLEVHNRRDLAEAWPEESQDDSEESKLIEVRRLARHVGAKDVLLTTARMQSAPRASVF